MICFGCSAKISFFDNRKRNKFGCYHQRIRWIYRLHCNKCKKTFDYLDFQQHKELFKITLIAITGDTEKAARLQALRDAKKAAKLQALRDAEEAATRLQALRDAEEAARLQALHACRSFSSNVGQCYSFGENLNIGYCWPAEREGAHYNFYGRVSHL
jgi:hypothetical protein